MPNNNATQAVCNGVGNIEKRTEFGVTFDECHAHKRVFIGFKALSNCAFRKACQAEGATGADSSCRSKVDDFFGSSKV
ncbi:uncharacterized protein CTRU02_203217 [Colletotrichum truncatum]|uniref:Uncharacterized protein n=1 Tax=Colletotrichum truncatum TaxID=5467 RepID=A0ACC3Z8M1_COLTU|nr:uncharacterized protein CTRU02_09056 [Colletotrichum truncatum]KAF6789264.1 hypothetical protein CTRU02_09056 [Colletotrichum truncatum]